MTKRDANTTSFNRRDYDRRRSPSNAGTSSATSSSPGSGNPRNVNVYPGDSYNLSLNEAYQATWNAEGIFGGFSSLPTQRPCIFYDGNGAIVRSHTTSVRSTRERLLATLQEALELAREDTEVTFDDPEDAGNNQ
jgi:hypothetical protein